MKTTHSRSTTLLLFASLLAACGPAASTDPADQDGGADASDDAGIDALDSGDGTDAQDDSDAADDSASDTDGADTTDGSGDGGSNEAPTADAGADLLGTVGLAVALNGSASSDPDGDTLTYFWTLTSAPDGSAAALVNATSASASLTPDLVGTYVAQLVVSDGEAESLPDTVTVTVGQDTTNNPPTALFVLPASVRTGRPLTLDGGASSDPDGDALSFAWSVTGSPLGATASIAGADQEQAVVTPDVAGTWTVALVVGDGDLFSAPLEVSFEASVFGARPVADAGPDGRGVTGDLLRLDGTASVDPDGDPITYLWSLTSVPDGSTAELSDPTLAAPTLRADVAGTYTAELVVSDGGGASAPDSVSFVVGEPPCVLISEYLEGSASNKVVELYNCGTNALDLAAVGLCTASNTGTSCASPIALEGTLAAGDVFVVCNPGVEAGVIAPTSCDQRSGSLTFNGDDRLGVYADNDGVLGYFATTDVMLDAFGEFATAPSGRAWADVTFRRCSPTPYSGGGLFLLEERYFEFALDDGSDLGVPPDLSSNCVIPNRAPTANAGADRTVNVGTQVNLSGGASSDPDGDTLAFLWSLAERPAGGTAGLVGAGTASPSFTPDAPGTWRVTLTVSDGTFEASDETVVTANRVNRSPIADAGLDASVPIGSVATLSGVLSSDPDGDTLTYAWRFVSRPVGSAAAFTTTTDVTASFTPDVLGAYSAELTVSDGARTATDVVVLTATAVNHAPVAEPTGPATAVVGSFVELDGAASTDSDGDALTFAWTLTRIPAGSVATLRTPNDSTAGFVPDVAGLYSAQLTVSDGLLVSAPVTVDIIATDAGCLIISEVIDGSANNKAIELFNCGSTPVDLDPYRVCVVANGAATCAGSIRPAGTLAAGDTYSVCQSASSAPVLDPATCDLAVPTVTFNGNDRILVFVNGDGNGSYDAGADTAVDAFGETSSDPGANLWVDRTLRRCNRTPYLGVGAFDVDTYFRDGLFNDFSDLNVAPALTSCPPIVTNRPPVAVAVGAPTSTVGEPVLLDGTGSNDPDGDTLQYAWLIVAGPDLLFTPLVGSDTATPSFTPALTGLWTIQLTVSDGALTSVDTVTVDVRSANAIPVADAGADLAAPLGSTVTLDGSASVDPEDAALTYEWAIETAPVGSTAALVNASSPLPTFTPDVEGTYVFSLVVFDGTWTSFPDTVTLSVGGAPCLRFSEYIDGTGNTKALELHNCGATSLPMGAFRACVFANDATSCVGSTLGTSTLAAGDTLVLCNGGYDTSLIPDGTCDIVTSGLGFNGDDRLALYLDGDGAAAYNASTDTLVDAFGELLVRPAAQPWFDRTLRRCNDASWLGVGEFVVSDFYTDGAFNDFSNLGVAPVYFDCGAGPANTPPVADAGFDVDVTLGESVLLDATASSDADGDTLLYTWTVSAAPAGGFAEPADANADVTELVPDAVGEWRVVLTVTDPSGASASDEVVVRVDEAAVGASCLRISEVVEGSSSNKAIEIHNCSSETASLDGINICLYANTATACSATQPLAGTLAAGDTLVLCNGSLSPTLVPGDVTCVAATSITSFNGNDRLALYRNNDGTASYSAATDTILDAFGELARAPASDIWANMALRRCNPDPFDGARAFDAALFYTQSVVVDDFSDLGVAPTYPGCP